MFVDGLAHDMKAFSYIGLLTAYFSADVLNSVLIEDSLTKVESYSENFLYLIDFVLGKDASAITESGGDFE